MTAIEDEADALLERVSANLARSAREREAWAEAVAPTHYEAWRRCGRLWFFVAVAAFDGSPDIYGHRHDTEVMASRARDHIELRPIPVYRNHFRPGGLLNALGGVFDARSAHGSLFLTGVAGFGIARDQPVSMAYTVFRDIETGHRTPGRFHELSVLNFGEEPGVPGARLVHVRELATGEVARVKAAL